MSRLLKRAWWLAVAGLAGGVLAWQFHSTAEEPTIPINEATYERIRLGMTVAEVETLIGAPPGDYCKQPRFELQSCAYDRLEGEGEIPGCINASHPEARQLRSAKWWGEKGKITLGLNSENKVQLKVWRHNPR